MFRKLVLSAPLCASLALLSGCATHVNTAPPAVETAQNIQRGRLISQGWQFVRQDVPGAEAVAFDDRSWAAVDLPHTWNVADGGDGGNNYYRGPGWYRKHLTITSAEAKQSLFLRFGAASLVADVYVNGQRVGEHRGGFAAFCFDVTSLLHAGDNVVAVRVDNTKVPDVAPLSGDFTVFGGLYRDVELLALDPVHISPIDEASPGVYIRQSQVSQESATLDITAKLTNTAAAPHATVAKVAVYDANGQIVASQDISQPLGAGANADLHTTLKLAHPHLWNGTADPYLYHVTVSLIENGQTLDAVTQPLGLRSFYIDPNNGFILNNHSYPLHGVNVHQEMGGKGWAASKADQELGYGLIQQMGATVVRMAHYQHFDYEYSLCDQKGIVVWAEVPMVNEIGKDPNFDPITKQQLRELIKQNYNHPSIAFWSLFNEVNTKDTDPRWQLLHEMNDLAHQLDPTRLTTGAIAVSAKHKSARWTDATSYNRYFGWYDSDMRSWGKNIDTMYAQLNHLPVPDTQPSTQPSTQATTEPSTEPAPELRGFAFSEYGAGGSIRQHEVDPYRPGTTDKWHAEEYESLFHEHAYLAMKARPYVWGTFVWAMFDFSVDKRNEGDHPGRNDKGLVTFDRQTPKDAFYFYKANWSKEPFVHLTDARYQPHPAGPADIKVYSNCDTVELWVNGHSLGTVKNADGIFVWPQVIYSSGRLHAVAKGIRNGRTFTDEVTWTIDKTAATHPQPKPAPKKPASHPATTQS